MTKIIINGACGRMGRMIAQAAGEVGGIEIAAGVDIVFSDDIKGFPLYGSLCDVREEADVLIDFTVPEAIGAIAGFCENKGCGCVLATTAYSKEQEEKVLALSEKVPVFRSANMSLGINLLIDLIKKAAAALDGYDVEIIEMHHKMKADSPSGTALMLADAANEALGGGAEYKHGRHSRTEKRTAGEIGIHAVRGGTITGDHRVLFIGTDETIEIRHSAQSRMAFAQGAVRAARFISGKPAGLYSMKDMLSEI